jgi:hypothetical protein
MKRNELFVDGWRVHSVLEKEGERERLAVLNKPPAPNPPALLAPTRCRVLKALYIGGGVVGHPGQVVQLPAADAASMVALKRVEILP